MPQTRKIFLARCQSGANRMPRRFLIDLIPNVNAIFKRIRFNFFNYLSNKSKYPKLSFLVPPQQAFKTDCLKRLFHAYSLRGSRVSTRCASIKKRVTNAKNKVSGCVVPHLSWFEYRLLVENILFKPLNYFKIFY